MAFNLILLCSGVVSQQTKTASQNPALRHRAPRGEALWEKDEINAPSELVPQQAEAAFEGPTLRRPRALWGGNQNKAPSSAGPKECVKVHTDIPGSLTLKIVRRINGKAQGFPVKCTQQDEIYCAPYPIKRVDVWSGSRDKLWQGKIYTNVNDGSYQQMTPTQKWNPHWMAAGPCNRSSPIAVTGTCNKTCKVCTCQRTGPGRICSLVPQGAPPRKCIPPTKGNYVEPRGKQWTCNPTPTRPQATRPLFRPRPQPRPQAPAPAPAPATLSPAAAHAACGKPKCDKCKPEGFQGCRSHCDCAGKKCVKRWVWLCWTPIKYGETGECREEVF